MDRWDMIEIHGEEAVLEAEHSGCGFGCEDEEACPHAPDGASWDDEDLMNSCEDESYDPDDRYYFDPRESDYACDIWEKAYFGD